MSNLGGTWTQSRWVAYEKLNVHGLQHIGILEKPEGVFGVRVFAHGLAAVYRGKPTADLLRAEREFDDVKNAALLDALPESPAPEEDIYTAMAAKIYHRR